MVSMNQLFPVTLCPLTATITIKIWAHGFYLWCHKCGAWGATKTDSRVGFYSDSDHLAVSQLSVGSVWRRERRVVVEEGGGRWPLVAVELKNRNWIIRLVCQRATAWIVWSANHVRSRYPRCASFVLMYSTVTCITSIHRRHRHSAMMHSKYEKWCQLF